MPTGVGRQGSVTFRVAIANRKFVERYIGAADPIGRRVGFGGDPGTPTPIEIVGVVGTSKYVALRDEAEPQLFFPVLETNAPRALSVYVRTGRSRRRFSTRCDARCASSTRASRSSRW